MSARLRLLAIALLGFGLTQRALPGEGGGVLVLSSSEYADGQWTSGCLSESLKKLDPKLALVDANVVKDALYPWLDSDLLEDQASEEAILGSAMLRQRASELGIRYIVGFTHTTKDGDLKGPFLCAQSGCLGVGVIRRETRISAYLWDMQRGLEASNLGGHGKAHDLLLGYVLPVWIPMGGSTKHLACTDLARHLSRIMQGDPDSALAAVPAGDAAAASLAVQAEQTFNEKSALAQTQERREEAAQIENAGKVFARFEHSQWSSFESPQCKRSIWSPPAVGGAMIVSERGVAWQVHPSGTQGHGAPIWRQLPVENIEEVLPPQKAKLLPDRSIRVRTTDGSCMEFLALGRDAPRERIEQASEALRVVVANRTASRVSASANTSVADNVT